MPASLNETEQTFVVWHATPKGHRDPSNFQDLCKSLHISQATGYRWLKRPAIRDAIDTIVREAVGGPDKIMAIVGHMAEVAMSDAKDRVQAATLLMRYAGVLNDKLQVSTSAKSDIEEMSEEELAQEIENLQIRRARSSLSVSR